MTLWIIIGVIVLLVIFLVSIYNRLVSLRNRRENAFADIDVQLRQRHDLIPQLLNTVKGYMKHEADVLIRVTEARSNAMNATTIDSKIAAEANLSQALGGLRIQLEAYPDLKANQNFLELQAQLEGTENRIAVERKKFNEVVQEYNTTIRRFPGNISAAIFGFDKKGYFESTPGSEVAPEVKF